MTFSTPIEERKITVEKQKSGHHNIFVGRFFAMASPCEVLMDSQDERLCKSLIQKIANEAWRIENTFSRYRDDNLIFKINNSKGKPIEIDAELLGLIKFADQCYRLSDGLFDITSGVLRRIWKFDGSANIPSRKQAKELLKVTGWDKAVLTEQNLQLKEGMQIDLGGIGKEYAVDRVGLIANQQANSPVLINFGGDLYSTKPPSYQPAWEVGIESLGGGVDAVLKLKQGALATSGDARRFLLKDGKRYSHVLNPRTGWSVSNAPSSVTVAAPRCIDAGFLSTLAMLKGKNAEEFLAAQDVAYWVQRE